MQGDLQGVCGPGIQAVLEEDNALIWAFPGLESSAAP